MPSTIKGAAWRINAKSKCSWKALCKAVCGAGRTTGAAPLKLLSPLLSAVVVGVVLAAAEPAPAAGGDRDPDGEGDVTERMLAEEFAMGELAADVRAVLECAGDGCCCC